LETGSPCLPPQELLHFLFRQQSPAPFVGAFDIECETPDGNSANRRALSKE
jgi:hypothetical protein